MGGQVDQSQVRILYVYMSLQLLPTATCTPSVSLLAALASYPMTCAIVS